MKKTKLCKKTLEEILSSQNYELLSSFSDGSQWDDLNGEDKVLLSMLFVMQGEKLLEQGDNKVLDSFKLANLVSPNTPEIMFRQGVAFARQIHNIYCLKAANRVFESVVVLKPDYFEAWHVWGNALVLMGIHSREEKDFQNALTKFKKAEELASSEKHKLGEFYRDYGVLWYHYGQSSGEASDFKLSLLMYQKALKLGSNSHDLWNDYGNCLVELSSLLNKHELLVEAVEMYWKGIRLKPDFFDGWHHLSKALKTLYELHPLDSYYTLAFEAFDQASKLDPKCAEVWIKWGQLQLFKGKSSRDINTLQDSCQKFETADLLEPANPSILRDWAEALIRIGEGADEIKIIKEAEEKIIKSIELSRDHARSWLLYGNCLTEIGRYFDHADYFTQAIEKYRIGLNLYPKESSLWHGLGIAYLSLGHHLQDLNCLQEAADYCQKAIEFGGHPIAQYWNDWGIVLMKMGTMTDEKELVECALNRFEQALRLRSQDVRDVNLEPEWLYNYGCALDFLGDFEGEATYFEKAINALKKVIEADPYFRHAYYNLAIAYSHHGEISADLESYSQANKYMEAYAAMEPEDDFAWHEWGVTLIEMALLVQDPTKHELFVKLMEEAEGKFQHARVLGNTTALYHLACIHSLTGNYPASLHFLEHAKINGALPPVEELLSDHWIDGVRHTAEFREFLLHLEEDI